MTNEASKTPRTDEFIAGPHLKPLNTYDDRWTNFCRQLETELTDLKARDAELEKEKLALQNSLGVAGKAARSGMAAAQERNRAIAQRDALVNLLERLRDDIILDRQDAEYYKRIMKVHCDWIKDALKPIATPQAHSKSEYKRLKAQVETAMEIIQRGVDLMTDEQLGKWKGVRSFLEQQTDDYLPESPQDGWQPIETAPTDGTRVLLFAKWPFCHIELSSWIGAPHNYWRENINSKFTHWSPLPEPPQ